MKTIYLNPRAWRVRVAQAAIWLGAALCVWLAFFAPPNPADRAKDEIVALVGACAMVCAVVMFELYLRLYVLRIERERDTLLVTTLATAHHRQVRVDLTAAEIGAVHRDMGAPGLAPGYDNSWQGLRATGQRLPFIIDVSSSAHLEPGPPDTR